MTPPNPAPPFWPRGADEALVRECNCDWCAALVAALEDYRDGVAVTGEDQTLAAYAGGDD